MIYHVYFPRDLIKDINDQTLVGFKIDDVFIAVRFIPNINLESIRTHTWLNNLEIIGGDGGYFNIKKSSNNLPIISNDNDSFTIILFNPPNFKNLEYFSINPILLQSMGELKYNNQNFKLLDNFQQSCNFKSSISDEKVLDKINIVLKLRIMIDDKLCDMGLIARRIQFNYPLSFFHILFKFCTKLILYIQYFTVLIIHLINYPIFNSSLVKLSQVFQQLDLRLKQITYFPVQFLCYFNKSILYRDNSILLKELGLPMYNSNLNINNSNYINLYNSIWLIINDVLIGSTIWKIIDKYQLEIFDGIHWGVKKWLIDELEQLIIWISYNHPAGFKLNNELGKFMGDLFLWSLKMWEVIMYKMYNLNLPVSLILKIICYMGISFLISLIIDLLNFMTIHMQWFYHTASRIYKKQIEVIKSLFQLFRGKKYNVLRIRVDNLNNYSQPNAFEIDHLLLGTLIFMILILLLPTIFSFYLTFFISRLIILLVQNFFENLLIILNFLPIFVILLKFKNSNRLQGGIMFEILDYRVLKINYLQLSNKSLTYSEIFQNFSLLFRKLKNFRISLVHSFLIGELIGLHHNNGLKFDYLMLPQNVSKSIDIWKYFTKL